MRQGASTEAVVSKHARVSDLSGEDRQAQSLLDSCGQRLYEGVEGGRFDACVREVPADQPENVLHLGTENTFCKHISMFKSSSS